jgi:hypothetical protein
VGQVGGDVGALAGLAQPLQGVVGVDQHRLGGVGPAGQQLDRGRELAVDGAQVGPAEAGGDGRPPAHLLAGLLEAALHGHQGAEGAAGAGFDVVVAVGLGQLAAAALDAGRGGQGPQKAAAVSRPRP